MRRKLMITTEEFDKKFDDGEDIFEHLDLKNASRSNLEQKRVNIDLPIWMIEKLDKEAKRLGVARQAIMKMFLADRLTPMAKAL
jgi:hypothetical protein